MQAAILQIISALASVMLTGNTFERIRACVQRWDDKLDPDGVPYSGDEKRAGVKDELVLIGVYVSQWLANLAIELAVAALRTEQGRLSDGYEQ